MEAEQVFKTLLFYKYADLPEASEFVKSHLAYCQELGLKGRILVATEGINGAVSGSIEQIDQYMSDLQEIEQFSGIDFKIGYAKGHIFQKMHVRLRDELCVLNLNQDIDFSQESVGYITPLELYRSLESGEEIVLIDTRNDYEWEVGKFKNAITMDLEFFRDFPEAIDQIAHLKDKQVVTYCTGGIRCEKAAPVLQRMGFTNVRQLKGGILKYASETDGKHWEGKCFMFDDRLVVPINTSQSDTIISKCSHCKKPSDRYMNCPNVDCNILYLCCSLCDELNDGFCADICKQATRTRDRRPVGYIEKSAQPKV